MKTLLEKLNKYYALIDAIVDLQDDGHGDNKLSELQDHANSKIVQILEEITELENA